MTPLPAEPRPRRSSWKTQRQLSRLDDSPRRADETFSFAVIGDAEPGRFIWNRLLFGRPGAFSQQLRRLASEDVDCILQLGDMVSRGLPAQYDRFLNQLERDCPDRPYLTVMGNHDRHFPHGHSSSVVYRSTFGRPNYWFDRGPARFVVLDTSEDGLTTAQLKWLRLALTTDKVKLVFMHKPPAGLWKWTLGGVGGFTVRSREFMDLMAEKEVQRVYMGHVHGFGHRVVGPTAYVLSGGGGSPLYPSPAPRRVYHFLKVEVGPDGVRETVQELGGRRYALDLSGGQAASREPGWSFQPQFGLQLGLKFLAALAPLGSLFALRPWRFYP